MSGTPRTITELYTQFASGGNITAQDHQDFIASVYGIHLIETIMLGGDGVITFDAIPAYYRDLMIVGRVRSSSTAVVYPSIEMRVGATTVDTGANYQWAGHTITNVTLNSADNQAQTYAWVGMASANDTTAGIFGSFEMKIYNYANATEPRNWLARSAGVSDSGMTAYSSILSGGWQNSANPIDIITLYGADSLGNFEQGTHLTLYGMGAT